MLIKEKVVLTLVREGTQDLPNFGEEDDGTEKETHSMESREGKK